MKKIISFLSLSVFQISIVSACIVFTSTGGGITFAGNNEDSFDNDTELRFVPPAAGKQGCIFWGYSKHSYAQGGVNEAGLFWDGTAVPYSEYYIDENKAEFADHLFEYVLMNCKTVAQAVEMIELYNWEAFPYGNFLLADKTGASVIIGVGQNAKIEYRYKNGNYQVLSNFNVFKPEEGGFPDKRHSTAMKMLSENNRPGQDNFRSILSAVHQEFIVQTVYSTICDLNNGIIYLYNFHDFENVKTINISGELNKGSRNLSINSLFDNDLYSEHIYNRFKKEPLSIKMKELISSNRTDRAIELYEELNEKNPIYYCYCRYDFGEQVLLDLMDELISESNYSSALEIGLLSVKYFPQSAETYTCTGDVFMKLGDYGAASEYYRLALDIEPGNEIILKKITETERRLR